jgi:hypothetical protein
MPDLSQIPAYCEQVKNDLDSKADRSVPGSPSAQVENSANTIHMAIANGNSPSPPYLSEKAARLVQAGLPWPGEEALEDNTRKLVVQRGVPWIIGTVRCVQCHFANAPLVLTMILLFCCVGRYRADLCLSCASCRKARKNIRPGLAVRLLAERCLQAERNEVYVIACACVDQKLSGRLLARVLLEHESMHG